MQIDPQEWHALAQAAPGPEAAAARQAQTRALNQAFLVLCYDAAGRIQSANFQFLRLFGCALDDIVGQDAARFLSKSVKRTRLTELWARLADGQVQRETGLWIAAGGQELWLDSRYLPQSDEQGRVVSVVQIAEDITDRLGREAEEHGQIQAIEATHAVAHLSLDGHLLWANDRFLAATGYSRTESLGLPHRELMPPEQRDSEAYRQFWAGLRAGQASAGEYRRRRKDGRDLWLQATYCPILDPAGRPTKVVKYAVDITEQKARQTDYEWQVAAVEKSNCVVTFDLHGTILGANALFLRATGYTEDEVIGRHHRMFLEPAEAHGNDYAAFWSGLRRGEYQSGLYKRVGKDGAELWLQATYNPIFDAGGQPVKVVKYASVVTDERRLQVEHQGQIAAIDKAQCTIAFALDGTILDANENFLRGMGYRYAEVRGQHHRMFVEPAHAASTEYARFWEDLRAGRHCVGEYRRIGRDGREVWLQASYNPIRDLNGQVCKVVKYATDITAEKLRQADFEGQIEAIRKSQDVIVMALDGRIQDVNQRALDSLGYTRDELVGQPHHLLVDREAAAQAEDLQLWADLKAGLARSGMFRRLAKGGKEVWLQASYNPILDLSGRTSKVVMYASDVTDNVALAEAFADAKRQAQLDAATSLPNRAKLSSFLGTHLADRSASLAVFYLDLDGFGQVNERFGPRGGDLVLGAVADRLRRMLREDQIVARVGGDEFVVAAPGMGPDAVERFAASLMKKIAEPMRVGDEQEATVGVSIGIAVSPGDGNTADELLRAADVALGASKKEGGHCRSYFSNEMNERLRGQRRLIEEMRNSLLAGDFYLDYQPRYEAATRRMRSVEALVRWAHPERGRISPMEFVPLAEQCGLIVPLGEHILLKACEAAVQWPDIGVSVNLSPKQFADDELVDKVREVLARTGLPPGRLELEVTEGVLLADGRRALDMLNALKGLGIHLAIDDFGTGYSSLSYLRNFPFDVIKIDRSFVRDLHAAQSSRPIVQAVLALGRALGLSVTAEGVETQAQLDLLVEDGCDELQGFLLAMPSPPEDIQRLLQHAGRQRELAQAIGRAA